MVHNVVLEKFDVNMEEATVGGWLVAEGDRLDADQPLVELITDKATFDYNSPVEGVVRRLVARPGSVVPVGYVLAQIGAANAALPEVDEANRALLEAYRRRQAVHIETGRAEPSEDNARPPPGQAGGRVRATPAARRLAREEEVALDQLPAAAEGRVVTADDVRAWLAQHGR